MLSVNLYIETDSRYVGKSEKRYGYLLEYIHNGRPITRYGFGQIEGTWHQAILTALAEGMERLTQTCRVTIYSQDDYVMNTIDGDQTALWAANDFIKLDGSPIANRTEWRRLWRSLKNQEVEIRTGEHTYSIWMKAEMKGQAKEEKSQKV